MSAPFRKTASLKIYQPVRNVPSKARCMTHVMREVNAFTSLRCRVARRAFMAGPALKTVKADTNQKKMAANPVGGIIFARSTKSHR